MIYSKSFISSRLVSSRTSTASPHYLQTQSAHGSSYNSPSTIGQIAFQNTASASLPKKRIRYKEWYPNTQNYSHFEFSRIIILSSSHSPYSGLSILRQNQMSNQLNLSREFPERWSSFIKSRVDHLCFYPKNWVLIPRERPKNTF